MNQNNTTIQDCKFNKFTNAELYYVISSLLGLGDPGFAPERLYLSFDEMCHDLVPSIRFLLITESLDMQNNLEVEITCFHLGQIDCKLDQIQIYSSQCLKSEFDQGRDDIDISFIRSAVINKSKPNIFRPLTFLRGIDRIVSNPNCSERRNNDLFELYWNTSLFEKLRNPFDFGDIGPLGTNFSGNYYLLVRPSGQQFGRVAVNNFFLSDNDDDTTDQFENNVEISETFVDSRIIQMYERGESEKPSLELFRLTNQSSIRTELSGRVVNVEDPEEHKQNILPAITETVYRLLVDLSPSTKEKLLSGETVEELIILCKKKYVESLTCTFLLWGSQGRVKLPGKKYLVILMMMLGEILLSIDFLLS